MHRAQRKNVTTACKACRDSKIKCNGAVPRCAHCAKRGKDCQYDAKEDKRKLSLRPALGILRDRVQQLHEACARLGGTVAPMNQDDKDLVNNVLESVGFARIQLPDVNLSDSLDLNLAPVSEWQPELGVSQRAGEDPSGQFESLLAPQLNPAHNDVSVTSATNDMVPFDDWSSIHWDDEGISPDWLWAGMPAFENSALMFPSLGTQSKLLNDGEASLAAPELADADDSNPEDEVDPGIVSQVAARFGSLQVAPDGKLRYFGTSTNTHLFKASGSRNTSSQINLRSLKLDGARLLRNADLDQHVDHSFEDHLIKIYFSWHNSCNPIVDKSVFWAARRQAETGEETGGFYSEVLVNAMCAIGASYESRYHPDLVPFPRPLGEFFAERARILLEIELDSPCASTVQALLLLSSHEAGVRRIARSWLYSGMAMRLCFDIGLHVSTDFYVEQGIMSASESRARQTAFWGSYVMNYRSSFSLGRPFTLDDSEITLRKPHDASNTTREVWYPYPSGASNDAYNTHTQMDGRPDLVSLISERRITLCDLVEPIARALYGNTSMPIASLQELSENATAAMFRWREQLPVPLQIQTEPQPDTTPQVIVLHLEYNYLQILVHRPWTSRAAQPVPARGRGFRHARQTCIESACEMARLLVLFEKCFGYRRLNVETVQILPSAALILIFASVSIRDSKDPSIVSHLNTVLRALDELSNIYACAREHLDGLLLIQGNWRLIYRQKQQQNKRRLEDGHAQGTSSSRYPKPFRSF